MHSNFLSLVGHNFMASREDYGTTLGGTPRCHVSTCRYETRSQLYALAVKLTSRITELKELITLHAIEGHHGGDLHKDTVHIIGATLDLQEKVGYTASYL